MPLPTIADCARVAFEWTLVYDTQVEAGINVMHFHTIDDDLDALLSDIDAAWNSTLYNVCGNTSRVQTLVATLLGGGFPTASFDTGVSIDWKGGSSGAVLPAVAGCVSLRTGLSGRSKRGRVYLPAIAESAVANGKFETSPYDSLNTAWETLLVDLAVNNHELMVASYLHSTAEIVTTARMNRFCATQRRRQQALSS